MPAFLHHFYSNGRNHIEELNSFILPMQTPPPMLIGCFIYIFSEAQQMCCISISLLSSFSLFISQLRFVSYPLVSSRLIIHSSLVSYFYSHVRKPLYPAPLFFLAPLQLPFVFIFFIFFFLSFFCSRCPVDLIRN